MVDNGTSLESFSGQVGGMFSPKTNTLSLWQIRQHTLEWILMSGAGLQMLRINVFAVLLNHKQNVLGNRDQRDEFYVSRLGTKSWVGHRRFKVSIRLGAS